MRLFPLHRHANADAESDAAAGALALRLELERARRHAHPLTLLRVTAKSETWRAAAVLRELVRAVDHVWTDRGDVFVLLVETDRATAQGFLTRARMAAPQLLAGESVGVGCFPEELTGSALVAATGHRPPHVVPSWSPARREAVPESST